MRVLLVEPNYKNKYPPIGLMKISTYHKNKGDYVEFVKGNKTIEQLGEFERIYITSLFTFHFDVTVQCINHYIELYGNNRIYVGGIAATLLPQEYFNATNSIHIISGKLTDSATLGYRDNVNIDILSLDYDILDDVDYRYPTGESYFIYTTVGCPNKCTFCAVPKLEPIFETTNNVLTQVTRVDAIYGAKKDMLIMDNNILNSDQLGNIIRDIVALGFNGLKNWVHPNKMDITYRKIQRRMQFPTEPNNLLVIRKLENIIFKLFYNILNKRQKLKNEYIEVYNEIYKLIIEDDGELSIEKEERRNNLNVFLYENIKTLLFFYEKNRSKSPVIRYVDCNQGLDARLVNRDNIRLLAQLPLRPCRYAYDDIKSTKAYERAFSLSAEHGIKIFSNYLLYNYKDTPEDLWYRMRKSVELLNSFNDKNNGINKISGFFFPMKYAPIEQTNRNYIGTNWNKKFLRAMNVILNVTKGVVAKELDFFQTAYGKDEMILSKYYRCQMILLEIEIILLKSV